MKKKPAQYVNGFLFDPTLSLVVLMRKNKPVHQEGLMNGIGGKIEPGETPLQAMVREFKEEAWPNPKLKLDWKHFATMVWKSRNHPNGAEMHLFRATGNVHAARSLTAEKVEVVNVSELMDRCDAIFNVRFMIQMARSFYFGDEFSHYVVQGVPSKED